MSKNVSHHNCHLVIISSYQHIFLFLVRMLSSCFVCCLLYDFFKGLEITKINYTALFPSSSAAVAGLSLL